MAVTATVVHISDPQNRSHVAHVDASGRLSVNTPNSTVNVTGLIAPNSSLLPVTSLTSATLALTRIALANPGSNSAYPKNSYHAMLYQASTTTTACNGSGGYHLIAQYTVEPGDDIIDDLATPLVVRPIGARRYCLELELDPYGGTPANFYNSYYNISAATVSGTYTGTGSAAHPVAATPAGEPVLHHTRK